MSQDAHSHTVDYPGRDVQMPRFRQTAEIVKLMGKKERIRNIGVVAHIDHGKTTMTDSLLVEAGLLPLQIAGSARVLDYLEEEQRRGITIKTANISFLHELNGLTYLINLMDTPGHVDFGGKVARALRAIDGAIIVVDAVEEIMAQTETVMRQALAERVKPVLFINKVDRLIKGLQFSPKEIQKKFERIIADFNNIIELYAEPEFSQIWKASTETGNVVFGSALDKWGFTLKTHDGKVGKLKDRDVWEAYQQGNIPSLSQAIPLYKAILDMVVTVVPNPVESQKYRIGKIWRGNLNSEIGQAMMNCDEKGPTVICVTAVQTIPNAGLVATGRVFSGSVKEGDEVHLIKANDYRQIRKVCIYMSAYREAVDNITAGNIAAVLGLESARAGETIVDVKQKNAVVPFENVAYLSEPVMTLAVEPANPKDLPKVLDMMNKLAIEDPDLKVTLNEETGQYLLGGMGELHLEVALNSLKKNLGGVKLVTSSPSAAYRETIFNSGMLVMAKSPNKQNRFSVQVEPLDSKTVEIVEKSTEKTLELKSRSDLIRGQDVWAFDEHANLLVGPVTNVELPEDVRNNIIQGFHWACSTGPLCEQPLRGVAVKLIAVEFGPDSANRDPSQIMRGTSRAILGSFLTAKPTLMEAIYKIEVSAPIEWFGACSNMIVHRRGKIESTEKKAALATIMGNIPVAETFGLSKEMRSTTSGRAFWQLVFASWERMPEKLAAETVKLLRERRGLPPDVPRPDLFVDEIRP
jgi:elongation factor 2